MQGGGFGNSNDLMTDLATGVLRSQGENYLQKGQAYVQSKMGWLSGGELRYLFDIDTAYGTSFMPICLSIHLLPYCALHATLLTPVVTVVTLMTFVTQPGKGTK